MAETAGVLPAAGAVTVERCNSSDQGWESYVSRSEQATFCHLPGWARVIDRVWGHAPYHLIARRGGSVSGVLPLFHVKSLLFGSSLVSSPNAVYGGVAADDEETRAALVAEAKRLARELRVGFLELRDTFELPGAAADADLHRKDLYVKFECPITTDEETLGKQFQRDIRRMVRVGIKNGLTVVVGRQEYLEPFYELYATSVRNLGSPVFPKKLFAAFLREFPDASDILLVKHGDRVAGGVLSFYFRDTVMPYYGGAYPEFYKAGVNNFMYWELMKSAAARCYTRFDFGRSKKGTGAYAFKHGWSMEERDLPYRFHLVGASELPRLDPSNPKFSLMIRVWQRLPLGLTKAIGPLLVRNIP